MGNGCKLNVRKHATKNRLRDNEWSLVKYAENVAIALPRILSFCYFRTNTIGRPFAAAGIT